MKKKSGKRNPQDTTLRNQRAAAKQMRALAALVALAEARLLALTVRVKALEVLITNT